MINFVDFKGKILVGVLYRSQQQKAANRQLAS